MAGRFFSAGHGRPWPTSITEKYRIIGLYAPNKNRINRWKTNLQRITKNIKKNTIILGDMNFVTKSTDKTGVFHTKTLAKIWDRGFRFRQTIRNDS